MLQDLSVLLVVRGPKLNTASSIKTVKHSKWEEEKDKGSKHLSKQYKKLLITLINVF